MGKPIFKKSTSRNAGTHEQLDIAIKIYNSKNWLIWLIFLLIFTVVLFWSIFGTVTIRSRGQGIILPEPVEVFRAVSQGNGLLITLTVQTGDIVKKGQILGYLEKDKLKQQIKLSQNYIAQLKAEEQAIKKEIAKQKKFLTKFSKRFYNALDEKKNNSESYKTFLQEYLEGEEIIEKKGAISLRELEQAQVNLYGVENQLVDIIKQKAEHELQMETYFYQWIRDIITVHRSILEKENELEILVTQLKDSEVIRSPIEGIVNQVLATPGDFLTSGTPVATIAAISINEDVIAFFPISEGKKVLIGMQGYTSPATAQKEEYGTIPGKVTYITEYPLDLLSVTTLLKNEELAKIMCKQGPPIYIKLSLEKNDLNYSGFRWTSRKGPPFKITPGTLCNVSVVTKYKRPITLVIPFLKKWLDE